MALDERVIHQIREAAHLLNECRSEVVIAAGSAFRSPDDPALRHHDRVAFVIAMAGGMGLKNVSAVFILHRDLALNQSPVIEGDTKDITADHVAQIAPIGVLMLMPSN